MLERAVSYHNFSVIFTYYDNDFGKFNRKHNNYKFLVDLDFISALKISQALVEDLKLITNALYVLEKECVNEN